MVYNMTSLEAASDPASVLIAINEITGGIFFAFFIFIIWMIIMVATRGRADVVDSFLASSFIVSIIAVLLWFGGATGLSTIIIPIVFLLFMIIIKLFWSED